MKLTKKILSLFIFLSFTNLIFAEDDLFSFSEDDLFSEDFIEEFEEPEEQSNLSKGIIFETGNIRVGGNFDLGIETLTSVYNPEEKKFSNNLWNTSLNPKLSANLIIDARPKQNLRMYTKFAMAYPFKSTANSDISSTLLGTNLVYSTISTNVNDWFNVKEIFSDFSIKDRVFFRFGLHTVTWGTGFFFSPVSDIINTSSINPEDTDEQVNGSLNLRTQITFPNTQNCLWFYLIPSDDFTNNYSATTYLRDTAFAAKYDFLIGAWEFGTGAFYGYSKPLKSMLTASGSIIGGKVSVFGEAVYQYGSDSEWKDNDSWKEKNHIFQGTIGANYFWKTPEITFAAQYYYDNNNLDEVHKYFTFGHNIAFIINFGRIFGTTDFTASIFSIMNFGKEELPDAYKAYLDGINTSFLNDLTISAMMNYKPSNEIQIGLGPYITWDDLKSKPTVNLKLDFTLGGGSY